MYEHMTYEVILKQMLEKVPSDVDKRQGSVIYDALAPAAAELAQMYIALDTYLNLAFASTSTGEYLERRTSEMGVVRHPAIKAHRVGNFYNSNNELIDVPLGSRFSAEDLNYVAIERMSTGQYVLECEEAGVAGNRPQGRLLPIDHIPGLARAEIGEVLLPGEDEESDASLLQRYHHRVRQPTTSGNVHHYKQWALDVPGVGDAHVFPLWDGPGTVKVVIVDTKKQPASPGLISEVETYIEEMRPIGADVTVVSGVGKSINISATVVLASGYTIQKVQEEFVKQAEVYLKETVFKTTYVSYAKVGTILLGTSGVIDYSNLKLNEDAINVPLEADEIPTLGTVELGV